MTDTDPITLKEACELVFKGKIGVTSLRAAAAGGKLSIFRIGRQDFTTLRDVREFIEQCRAESHRPASTTTRREIRGLSVMARDSSALAAIDNNLRKLRAN